MGIFIMILSVILLVMSLLLLIVTPVGGVIGICFSIFFFIYGRKLRTAKKVAAPKAKPSKPVTVSSPEPLPASSDNPPEEVPPSAGEDVSAKPFRHTFSCSVVGLKYRMKDVTSILSESEDYDDPDPEEGRIYKYYTYYGPCELEPEPTNKHDPNAIKVIVDGVHIGYIPSEKCHLAKKYMEMNPSARVEIYGGPYKEYDSLYERWKSGTTNIAARLTVLHD